MTKVRTVQWFVRLTPREADLIRFRAKKAQVYRGLWVRRRALKLAARLKTAHEPHIVRGLVLASADPDTVRSEGLKLYLSPQEAQAIDDAVLALESSVPELTRSSFLRVSAGVT